MAVKERSTITPRGRQASLRQLATGYLGLEGKSLVMGTGVKDR